MCVLYIHVIVILILYSPFIQSRNIDDFTYNNMSLMSILSRYHVNTSMVLTKADYLFIQNYIIALPIISLNLF